MMAAVEIMCSQTSYHWKPQMLIRTLRECQDSQKMKANVCMGNVKCGVVRKMVPWRKKDMQFAIGKDARGRYRYSRGNNKRVDKFCQKYWRNTMAYKEHRILVWRFNDQDIKLIVWNGQDRK